MAKIERALLSVSDKTGLVDFAKVLAAAGIHLISTGGTARALREAGLTVDDISNHTGFPEMLDGRVKTLHPKIHGGLLHLRDNPEHVITAQEHGIAPIDLVVVNLYPFEKTVANPDATLEEAIENIDMTLHVEKRGKEPCFSHRDNRPTRLPPGCGTNPKGWQHHAGITA